MGIINYLDDFIFISTTEATCNKMVRIFLAMCEDLRVPVATEKTIFATTRIKFLGMELDGVDHVLIVPDDKKQKAINALQKMIQKRTATVREIQALAGLLNFLC